MVLMLLAVCTCMGLACGEVTVLTKLMGARFGGGVLAGLLNMRLYGYQSVILQAEGIE